MPGYPRIKIFPRSWLSEKILFPLNTLLKSWQRQTVYFIEQRWKEIVFDSRDSLFYLSKNFYDNLNDFFSLMFVRGSSFNATNMNI